MIFSYALIVFVMKSEKASYIISLRQISVVFGVVFGNVFLNEQYGLIRFIASYLVFAGVYCI